ncbi:hypothetical protein HDA32_003450 [Spinactinospora alkalitolerans]|uniref:Uncharacterized protein n=1 Tax=Spinactinospora alkalitolerans TaxID=687207 RepID=A0A852U2Z6_9ACTN|nr:DUF3995 domain-containing protein [Spinactinospora alkalitolerans]NYE48330.1 hypothetical protein [Spinactinospora alkalitolerans]
MAWAIALWCIGFAAVNLVYEASGRFSDGPLAEYGPALSVMTWLVVVLKVAGAGVALLSVTRRPIPVPANLLAVLVWGAFALLGLYTLGSVVQAVGMVTGLLGSADRIDAAAVGYVLFFLAGAVGYGVLAVSHSRRSATPTAPVLLGVLGAPVLLGVVLVAVPALLTALGVMPH